MSETLKLGMSFNDGKSEYYVYSISRKNDGSITMQLRSVDAAVAAIVAPVRQPLAPYRWERPAGSTTYVPVTSPETEDDHDEI